MITKFKLFENINTLPKIGDWIILNENIFPKWFWENHSRIFQIKDINVEHGGTAYLYTIEINNKGVEEYGLFPIRKVSINQFEYWSSNKEELDVIIDSKKYNL